MTSTIEPETVFAGQPTLSGVTEPGPRYRRRPAVIGLGVSLLAVCGAGAAYLTQVSGDTVPVLAMTHTVYRGDVIDESDLTVAHAATDPALKPVAADQLDDTVGRRAVTDLAAGTLLTLDAVTDASMPAAGYTVVGVAVTEAQLPRHDLAPGDMVRIFDTPNLGDDPPADPPASVAATVVSVSRLPDTGQVMVDVVVDEAVAGPLVARVATGRVAVVLDSPETASTGMDNGEERP